MKKHLTTKQPASRAIPIVGTIYKLAVPFSVITDSYYGEPVFSLGAVRFKVESARGKYQLRALDNIPASWFINLN